MAGSVVPLTVHAVRRDGFDGDIELSCSQPMREKGFRLSGGWIPGGSEKTRMTLTLPRKLSREPMALRIRGKAVCGGVEVRRSAVAAEDMMQAFLYRHLVPTRELVVAAVPSNVPSPRM